MLDSGRFLKDFLKDTCGLNDAAIADLTKNRYGRTHQICVGAGFGSRRNPAAIKQFVRNADGEVYVPGSSVKGAIRTAILARLIRDAGVQHESGDKMEEALYLNVFSCLRNQAGQPDTSKAVNSIMRGHTDFRFPAGAGYGHDAGKKI